MSTQQSPKIHPLIVAKEKLDRRLVEHARYEEALNKIVGALLFPTDAKLLYIVGPTGVGKSRLFASVKKRIMDMIGKSLISDLERIPYVAFEVPSVQIGNFNWRSFYQAYLDQLRLPLAPLKETLKELPRIPEDQGLDYVLMKTLEHRRPLVTLLDEANHFSQVTSGKLLLQQMNKIKSMANRSNTLHICFGTYELARMADLSGQLARRGHVIHFSRYCPNNADMKEFKRLVRSFQECLPVAHHMDLSTKANYLYERTIGCVGTLKTWLMEALSHAYFDKRTEITIADLEATAYPINKLRTMLNEATEGEAIFSEEPKDHSLFVDDVFDGWTDDEKSESVAQPSGKAAPRRVGERAPTRDSVGGAFDPKQTKIAS
jgi:hypothetical protein